MNCWIRYWRGVLALWIAIPLAHAQAGQIGREVAIPEHLQNGQEFRISLTNLYRIVRRGA
jgi:hypothetical protein